MQFEDECALCKLTLYETHHQEHSCILSSKGSTTAKPQFLPSITSISSASFNPELYMHHESGIPIIPLRVKDLTVAKIKGMKVDELKNELCCQGLPISGVKLLLADCLIQSLPESSKECELESETPLSNMIVDQVVATIVNPELFRPSSAPRKVTPEILQ
ncbi:hypothetical protein HK096_011507 [Nowakowskiella sp. JEL0078]|nr:hypothetical protein HK096_011507 [Nowakowskiella sp. JEL0078]